MSITVITRSVAVVDMFAICDFCHIQAPENARRWYGADVLHLSKADAETQERLRYSLTQGGYVYRTTSADSEQDYASQLKAHGWKIETVHNKQLLACPTCAAK